MPVPPAFPISRILTPVTTHSLPVLSESDFDEHRRARIASELRALIQGDVRFTKHERLLHATDASFYQVEPIGVVVPRSIADVERIVQYCSENGLPILPRGGGTSLAGQAVNFAVIIDFAPYCCEILEVDPPKKRARVEPGVVLDDLRCESERFHLTFPPDPSTHRWCTLGGMIGNNSCGVHSVMGGKTEENVEELEVLTYDGIRLRVGSTSEEELRHRIGCDPSDVFLL
jgi:FAD/FMN-containing dehydrogenase